MNIKEKLKKLGQMIKFPKPRSKENHVWEKVKKVVE